LIYWREAEFLEVPKQDQPDENHQDEETREKLEDPENQGQTGFVESDFKGVTDNKEILVRRLNY